MSRQVTGQVTGLPSSPRNPRGHAVSRLQSHPNSESAVLISIKCHRRRHGPEGIFTNTSPTCSMVYHVSQSLSQL